MRAAILSLHSHADRSFLDDRVLALIAGDLRAELVHAVIDGDGAIERLAAALRGFEVVVYERVWSRAPVEALRALLPGVIFVSCEGEHTLLDPPAEYVCRGDLRRSVASLLAHLRGELRSLPRDTRARDGDRWRDGLGPSFPIDRAFRPNLRPVLVGASPARTFSIEGNAGCPYGPDARDDAIYAGAVIPEGFGRGCAFCTTGNRSDASPPEATAGKVLEQLRHVRHEAPELTRLVLKDQNPFGWLPEVIERCAAEGLGGFSLLLETRADWFLRNERRFVRALELAAEASIRICPFLVGIESFSRRELDRFLKGTTPETNERFLASLDAWSRRYPSLDLSHASFGFVLLTPWTTLDDLRLNLEAVERTGFDRLRGNLLVSRVRLYPDTALYYLAQRDGLLAEAHQSTAADSARRYGYFPGHPWRFAEERVARFAEVAAELTERTNGRDQVAIWRALLEAIEAGDETDAEAVMRAVDGARSRFARLVRPLSLDATFEGGWRFARVVTGRRAVSVRLEHADEPALRVDVVPRGEGGFGRSRHYDIRHVAPTLSAAQERALRAVCAAISANDR